MKKLTVAEYAEIKCISVQAVYKRINKLNTIEEKRNGKKQIFIILDEEQKPKEEAIKPDLTSNSTPADSTSTPTNKTNLTYNSTSTHANSTPDIKPNSTSNSTADSTSDIIELLQSQIKEKDKQIEEKDKQIERLQDATAEKDKQIKEQFERLTALLARSQELEAITHRLLGAGEAEQEQEDDIIDINNQKKKKVGFFHRIFKRNKEE